MAYFFRSCLLVGSILAFGILESTSSYPSDRSKTYVKIIENGDSLAVTCEGYPFLSASSFEGAESLCQNQTENVYIKSATYGRNNSEGNPIYCNFDQASLLVGETCTVDDVTQIFLHACWNSKDIGACDVTVSNWVFGNDPCPNVYKYISLLYKCSANDIPGYTKLLRGYETENALSNDIYH